MNYYEVLGIKPQSSLSDIKQAYRKLAQQHHPDKNLGNEKQATAKFKVISEAYTILSNEEKRREYDLRFAYASKTETRKRSEQQSARQNFENVRDVILAEILNKKIFFETVNPLDLVKGYRVVEVDSVLGNFSRRVKISLEDFQDKEIMAVDVRHWNLPGVSFLRFRFDFIDINEEIYLVGNDLYKDLKVPWDVLYFGGTFKCEIMKQEETFHFARRSPKEIIWKLRGRGIHSRIWNRSDLVLNISTDYRTITPGVYIEYFKKRLFFFKETVKTLFNKG